MIQDALQKAEDIAVGGDPLHAAEVYEELLDGGREAVSDMLHNLVPLYLKGRRPAQALAAARALTFFQPSVRNWMVREHVEMRTGNQDEALACCYRALELDPDDASAQGSRLFLLASRLDPLEYRKAAADWFASLPPIARPYRHNSSPVSPGRRVRVGYVSGDFRQHVMDRFLEALLLNHDYANFEVVCIDSSPRELRESESGKRLRAIEGPEWLDAADLSDEELSAQIVLLGVEVLVDLSGLTAHHRLGVFRLRSAPLQLTGVGFMPTTGAACFDFRLADYEFAPQYTEPLWRLPRAAVPLPLGGNIPVSPSPAAQNGYVTFGYVNGLHKLTPDSIRSFVEVLSSVPTSKLVVMLPGASDPATAASVLRRFDPVQDRVLLTESHGGKAFCELFRSIDVALDPAPLGGMTTTVDCLFHGVPVATSLPDRRTAADAYFLQRELGLNPSGTLLLDAERWSADLEALAAVRESLRDRYLAHPVGDPGGWVRSLEGAYTQMLEIRFAEAA